MLTLYYSPGACSLTIHIALAALQLPYELIKVDLHTHKTETGEDYYKINSSGAVPLLVLDNNTVITQNIAILTYLSEQDKNQQLIPPSGTLERIRCYEWLSLITSDLHKPFGFLFNPAAFANSPEAQTEIQERAKKIIHKVLKTVEQRLSPHQFLLGENFSAPDAYLFVISRWLKYFKFELEADYPKLFQLSQKIHGLPFVKSALEKEGLR